MCKKLTIISDIHGNKQHHLNLLVNSEYSLQLGDLGFNYEYLENAGVSMNHRFFGGNHDNYDVIDKSPYSLGDYGIYPGFAHVGFVRGADSIDKSRRTVGVDWWEKEQLDIDTCEAAIRWYELLKPSIMVTHTCPQFLIPFIVRKGSPHKNSQTRTSLLFDTLFEIQKPDLWVFGHWHEPFCKRVRNTTFVCVEKNQKLDISV